MIAIMKSYNLILLWFGFYYMQCQQCVTANRETASPCVAQSVSSSLIQLLTDAANKIIDEDYSEPSDPVSSTIEKKLSLSEKIFQFIDKNKDKVGSLDQLVKQQSSLELMLSSILDTVLTGNTLISNVETENTKNFEAIKETLANVNVKEDSGVVENFNVFESILKSISTVCEDVSQQILEKQNDTFVLMERLVNQKSENVPTGGELERLRKENQELKEKLRKQKPNTSFRPVDCNDLRISGVNQSGVYNIYPDSCNCKEPIRVWCDMETEGGGWTVVVARGHVDKHENFTRSWTEYERGFGHPEGEYWIGNANLHALTSNRRYSARLEVTGRGQTGRSKWGQWNNFEVASVDEKYRLSSTEYSPLSTLWNVLKTHSGEHFTTYDQDNDSSFDKNCAKLLKGGWWYGKCYDIHPTGVMDASDVNTGVSASLFSYGKKRLVPLKKLVFKIKPRSCILKSSVNLPTKMFCDSNNE